MTSPNSAPWPGVLLAGISAVVAAGTGPLRDVAIQALLDPSVHAVEYIRSPVGGAGTLFVVRDEGRFTIDVLDNQLEDIQVVPPLTPGSLGAIRMTAAAVMREPRRSAYRDVFAHRYFRVPAGLRLAILQALTSEGPLPLGELVSMVAGPADVAAAICALAVDGTVTLELAGQRIGPQTRVWRRS